MNEMVPTNVTEARAVQRYQVIDPVPILDTARFEHMQRIAGIMARSSLVPEALANPEMTMEQAVANCFLAVNQAVRWEMDPFAVAQCMSVVKGKLCFEGKLIAAVIEAKLKIRLVYEWDDKHGDALGIKVSGTFPGEASPRIVEGTVAVWKTDHNGSPWKTQPRKQLAYRGAREWARLHAPGIVLGVYSDDEMDDLSHASRSSRATNVTPPHRVAPSPSAPMIEHQAERAPAAPEPAKPTESQAAEKPQEPRRAPNATSASTQPAKPPAATAYDPEKVRAHFADALKAAKSQDDINDAWETIVDPVQDEILPPDRDDLERMIRLREAELGGHEGAEP